MVRDVGGPWAAGEPPPPLTWWRMLVYAQPNTGLVAVRLFRFFWLPLYFVRELRLQPAPMATAAAVYTGSLLYLVPLVGSAVEGAWTVRTGRRTPALVGAVLLWCATVPPLLWYPSSLMDRGSVELAFWVSGWMGAQALAERLYSVAYTAFGLALTEDYHARATLFTITGGHLVSGRVLGVVVAGAVGTGWYRVLLGVVVVHFFFANAAMLWLLRAHDLADSWRASALEETVAGSSSVPVVAAVRRAARNPPLLGTLAVGFLQYALLLLPEQPLVMRFVLGLRSDAEIAGWQAAASVCGLLGVPVWKGVSRMVGTRGALQTALIAWGLSFVPVLLTDSVAAAVLPPVFCAVGVLSLMPALVAAAADYDALLWATHRSEAVVSALLSWVIVADGVFLSVGSAVALAAIGFDSDYPDSQTPGVRWRMRWVVAFGAIPLCSAAALLQRVPLTAAVHRAVHRALPRRRAGRPVRDPVSGVVLPQGATPVGAGPARFYDHFSVSELAAVAVARMHQRPFPGIRVWSAGWAASAAVLALAGVGATVVLGPDHPVAPFALFVSMGAVFVVLWQATRAVVVPWLWRADPVTVAEHAMYVATVTNRRPPIALLESVRMRSALRTRHTQRVALLVDKVAMGGGGERDGVGLVPGRFPDSDSD